MSEQVIRARVRRGGDERRDAALQMAMEVFADPSISLLDQFKIEAGVLIPVLDALRAELGKERADELVTTAVRDWRRESILRAGARIPGSPREKWDAFRASIPAKVGDAVDPDILRDDAEAFDVNFTGCRFADLFHRIGEPALGAALACECDGHAAEVVGPELEFDRPQTIMGGASCCEFRYRFRFGETPDPAGEG